MKWKTKPKPRKKRRRTKDSFIPNPRPYINTVPTQSAPQNVVIYEDPLLSKRIEIIETGHQRIERSQEEMRQAFKRMEKDIDSIEKLAQESVRLFKEGQTKEDAYWEKLTDAKDDTSKKAITLGMGILLCVAVGLLLPYFKSQKTGFH